MLINSSLSLAEMRVSEIRYRSLFETAQEGILILNGYTLEITDANPYLMDLLGYTCDELVGKEIWEIGFFDDMGASQTIFRDVQAAGYVRYEHLPLQTKEGLTREVEFIANLYLESETKVIQCHIRDISVRKDLEAVRRTAVTFNRQATKTLERHVVERTAELERANKELAAFSYSVSHDLRAPLRHIDGFVRLLIKREAGRLDETSARYLEIVSDSVGKMGRLIDELLTFSRTSQEAVRFDCVDMNMVVTEVLSVLEPMSTDRKIKWEIDLLPDVAGDAILLTNVMTNLLSNAIKYTRLRSCAHIELGTVDSSDEWVTIFVRDNGAGFDMQYANKLFGVFQRLHRDDEFEGIGIGLATVQKIVHRHGGRVWAESEPDKGATFFMTLRRA